MIRKLDQESMIPLRHMVLRKNQPIETCYYPEDLDDGVFHLGAMQGEQVIAIASFYPQSCPSINATSAYRLRGMASHPDWRGKGVALQLLQSGINECKSLAADLLWFNARTEAVGFYKRLNFDIKGEEFDIPQIGPHYLMYRHLTREE